MTIDMTKDAIDEPSLVKIGAGGFATVYVVRGGPIAYKQVAHVSDAQAQILRHEYDILQEVYLRCNTDSFFAIPRAFAYNDPDQNSGGFVSSLPSLSSSARRHLAHPIVTLNIMTPFPRATYAMDRVHALPYDAGMIISKKYLPESLRRNTVSLCRLYFGKNYTNGPPSRFFNTSNFPLDEQRYVNLFESFPELLDPVNVVASEMGEMLSRLHFKACVDARDVEFVLGGDGGGGFTYFVIDYNQVCSYRVCISHS